MGFAKPIEQYLFGNLLTEIQVIMYLKDIIRGEMNMENTMKMYITADEVAELLGVSRGYAYKVIRGLNDELKAKGFRVISGKVPRKYFQEKYYGMVV